jgi:hypothetical protein
MLVALVQGVVRAFDEYFSPLNEAGGEEAGDHAKDDFLEEGRVHFQLSRSRSGAIGRRALTRVPIGGFS